MRERLTARVVLLDQEDRLLLMRGRLPDAPEGPDFWFTVGGGLEPGETLEAAALRETLEETGLADVVLGPVVWTDETVLRDGDLEPRHFRQRYILARTEGGALSRAGWQALEHKLVDELRWWTLEELRATADTVYPIGLGELLADVLAGRIAPEPLVIATLEGPVRPVPKAPLAG
jgi:ADP-ribose pyrophosphatase YjhB (NUDIX family)